MRVSLRGKSAESVINQIDTTGSHINGNSKDNKDKAGEFSKDELSAILKFGAQNM